MRNLIIPFDSWEKKKKSFVGLVLLIDDVNDRFDFSGGYGSI